MATFSVSSDARAPIEPDWGLVPDVFDPSVNTTDFQGFDLTLEGSGEVIGADGHVSNGLGVPTLSPTTYPAQEVEATGGPGFDWFDDFHVVPRSFDFGNLLSDQSTPIEVFNAFRREAKDWTSFTNNAGAGVSLGSQPSLPATIDALYGLPMTLDVSTTGDPFVDETLDFFFTGVGTAMVPIEIQRLVLWGLEPELPFSEVYQFFVQIQRSKDGTEKRQSSREYPRQAWSYRFIIEEGIEAALFDNLLFDFQSRNFGVPVWFDDTTVTAAVTAGDTVFTVADTAFRDFRVGGFMVLLTSQATFDVLEIASFTATTITVASPAINAYAVGTAIFPLAIARANQTVAGNRRRVGLREESIRFWNTDNVVDRADASAFDTYDSRVLLDSELSMLSGRLAHDHTRPFIEIDGGSGEPFIESPEDRNRPGRNIAIRAQGREAIWNLRGLIYELHGPQTSFYLPTYSEDLVPVSDLTIASDTLSVTNVGYNQFVRERQPKSDIRVNFVDGSTPLKRAIIGSVATSSTIDTLQVDSNWPATYTPAEVSRIEYLEKVRLADNSVRLRFDPSGQRAYLIASVVGVFE